MLIQVQQAEAHLVRALREIYGRAEKFVSVLRNSGIQLADLDLPKLFVPPSPDQSKELNQWLSSRACVASGLVQGLPTLLGSGFSGRIATSLSHAETMAAAAVAAIDEKDGAILGIGIDVESETRPVDDRIIVRISPNDTPGLEIDPIVRWTIKEAAFKACGKEEAVMKDFSLKSVRSLPDILVVEGRCDDAIFRSYTTTLTGHKITLAFAWFSPAPEPVIPETPAPEEQPALPIEDSPAPVTTDSEPSATSS